MMEEKRTTLIDIQHNLDHYKKAVKETALTVRELQKELGDLKKEGKSLEKDIDSQSKALKELEKAGKSNSDEYQKAQKQLNALKDQYKENTNAIEDVNTSMRAAKKEYQEAVKNSDDMARANVALEGSYDKLQAQLKIAERNLKEQTGLLSKNADGTWELSEGYEKASEELKEARSAVNDFNLGIGQGTTNVGLYEESISKALGGVNVFGVDGSEAFQGLQGGMGNMVKSGIKGMATLTKAFMTNPIGILILVILGAILALKKAWESFSGRYFQQMDKMKATIEAIGAAWDAVVDRIVSFFTGGEKAAKSISEVYEETKRLALEMRELEDAMKQFEQASARANLEVAKREVIYKDITRSEEERLEAAREAMRIEEERSEQELAYAIRNLEIIREKNSLTKSGREDVEAEADAQRRVYELEEKSLKTRVSINETLLGLEKQIGADKQKQFETERKAQIDLMKLRSDGSIESLKRILKAEYELSVANDELTATQRLVLRESYWAAVRAIDDEARVKDLEDAKRQNDEHRLLAETLEEQRRLVRLEAFHKRRAERAKEREVERADAFRSLDIDRERLAQRRIIEAQGFELTLEERMKRAEVELKTELEILRRHRELALTNEALTETERQLIVEQFRTQELNLEAAHNEAKRQLSQARIDQLRYEMGAVANALGAFAELAGKETAAGKAMAIAQATINSYLAATQILADPKLGPVAKGIAMAGVLTAGLAQVRAITKVKVPNAGDAGGGGGGGGSAPSPRTASPARGGGFVAQRATSAGQMGTQGVNMAGVSVQGGRAVAGEDSLERSNERLVDAIKRIPAPKVSVVDIHRKEKEMDFIETNATH